MYVEVDTVAFAFRNLGCSNVYPTSLNISEQRDWTKTTVSTEHTLPN